MAATILKQVSPGYIDRYGPASGAYDRTVDAYRMRYNKIPLQGARFFKTESYTGTDTWKIDTFGNLLRMPPENEDTDLIPKATPWRGFSKSFTIKEYRLGIEAPRSLTESALHLDKVRQMASGLMNSMRLKLEYSFAGVWNNISSTSYTGADGMPLCDTAHPLPRRQDGTWSNEASAGTALTSSTWATARKNLRQSTTDWGYKMPIMVRGLVVSAENEQKARELKAATNVPENALNQPWVFGKDNWEVMVYDYLTSTTAWHLWGDIPQEFSGMHYIQAVAPSIAKMTGQDTGTDIVWANRGRMRFAVGFSVERNIYLNPGA